MKKGNLKGYFARLLCLTLFYVVIFPAITSADNATTVTIGIYENPPKIFSDAEGALAGFWPDILRYIAAEEGWKIEWLHGTWAQGLERLEKNDIDILPDTGFTERRAEKFAFSSETVLLSWTRLYVRQGEEIDSMLDLEGKTIGALTKSVNLDGPQGIKEITREFEINCTFIEMDSYVEVFEALDNGSIDAGITNKDFGNAYEAQYAVKKTAIIFQPIRLQFAFSKGSSLTPHLIERIDYHLKKLKADGNSIYYQLLEKWLTVEPIEKPIISRQVLWILISLGGLTFVLFGGSFILRARVRSKTRELRQQIAKRQRVEKALRKSEEQFRAIFETAQDSIFIKDRTLKYTQANPAMEKLFKLPSSKLIGLTDEDLFSEEAASHIREVDSRVLGGEIIDERHAKPVKGIPYTFHLIKVPMRDSSGEIIGLCGIARDITEQVRVKEKLERSFLQLAEAASRAMEAQDPYTVGHQWQVAKLAKEIGEKMGLDQDRLSGIYIGGLLHDIGKLAVPSEILTQPGKLSKEEWGIIRSHPQRGYEILKETDFPWPVADMTLHHHERLDGSGYPDGLKDGELSLEVRILGVCDVVDAMSSDRPYRPARPQKMVIEELLSGRGTKYDGKVVDIMLEILEGGTATG